MTLVAIAWIYVVLMMSLAEATSTHGNLLGALITFVLYGVLPLSIVLYILDTPGRRCRRRALEARGQTPGAAPSDAPDGGGHAAGDAVTPEREET